MKKKNKVLLLAAGAAAVGVYRAFKGKGMFNRLRFADQHAAVANYVEANHPGAVYSAIESVGEGWSCVINDGGEKFLLYITCSEDGSYIFEENLI